MVTLRFCLLSKTYFAVYHTRQQMISAHIPENLLHQGNSFQFQQGLSPWGWQQLIQQLDRGLQTYPVFTEFMEMAWKKQEIWLAFSLSQRLHSVFIFDSIPENSYRSRLIQSKLVFVCCSVHWTTGLGTCVWNKTCSKPSARTRQDADWEKRSYN